MLWLCQPDRIVYVGWMPVCPFEACLPTGGMFANWMPVCQSEACMPNGCLFAQVEGQKSSPFCPLTASHLLLVHSSFKPVQCAS